MAETFLEAAALARDTPEPWLDDGDATLYHGDAFEQLSHMPGESVQCIVTSPPFWGLRDYGVDGQIGLEATPEAWCSALVAVFREARRVLRSDGVMWLEVGDSGARGFGGGSPGAKSATNVGSYAGRKSRPIPPGYKGKDIIGAPWLLADALRRDGWYLRAEIIWDKPNAMPESVKDRPSRSHSTVFLLSKGERYAYYPDDVREPSGANARSVWSVNVEASPHAHFAVMPTALAERCIRAASQPGDKVLDPFSGSGTTILVARRLGRHAVGVELNSSYLEIAAGRLKQLSLFA